MEIKDTGQGFYGVIKNSSHRKSGEIPAQERYCDEHPL